jgi:hypothetical protein
MLGKMTKQIFRKTIALIFISIILLVTKTTLGADSDSSSNNGTAELTWVPPTTNEDGSSLLDLAGYKIYYGNSPDNYSNAVDVPNPGVAAYVIEHLAAGTYYFVATAYDTSGNESIYSNMATKTIEATDPNPLPVVSLLANPSIVNYGGSTTLSWSATNADSCMASDDWSGSKGTSGNETVGPLTADSTFTLSCSGAGGSVSRTAIVTIPPSDASYQQDANGLVSIEAEHYHDSVSQGGQEWIVVQESGSSGVDAMEAIPNYGITNNTNYVQNSPRLDFKVNFLQAGVHYVWIRGIGKSNKDDSLHVGLNGEAINTSDRLHKFKSSWTWSNSTMDGARATLNVPSSGIHTLNLWMREDGMIVDKIVLTTDPSYIPSGTGPAESPDTGDTSDSNPTLAITINPATVDYNGSTTLTWSSTNADSCTASDDWSGSKGTSGNETVGPLTADSTFTLSCSGAGGSVSRTAIVTISPNDTSSYQQDANGLVSIEAEHYHDSVSQGAQEWIAVQESGSSGVGAMEAIPNYGITNNTNYVQNSPRLDFKVNFLQAGVHYVWIRGIGKSNKDDSLHVGLNGEAINTSDRLHKFKSSWTWSNSTMDGARATLNVPSPGIHTLNLWMREDGMIVDKIVLTTDPSYISSGTGPAESPDTGDTSDSNPTLTITANPATVDYNGSTTLSWSSTNTDSCTATDDWSGSKGTSGAETVSPLTTDSTFTLTCSGSSGDVTKSAAVTVGAAPQNPTLTLTADPSIVDYNGSTTLTWLSTNADTCTASGAWSGAKDTLGSEILGPLMADSTFTLSCTGDGGIASDSLTVTVTPYSDGTASLSWVPPTTNADGSVLDDLAGYKIYYGSVPNSYINTIDVNNPGIASYVVENLSKGTHYFAVTAYDASGNESGYSNEAYKVIE